MSTVDISPIVARMVALISTVPNIGAVLDHEAFDRDDWTSQLVTTIDGVPTLRGWMVTGPTLGDAEYYSQSDPANAIRRAWSYRIIGVEGLDYQASTAIATMRDNLVRIMDALDADRKMGGTAHQCEPCKLEAPPELRQIATTAAVVYAEITKIVVTVSSP